MSGAIEYGKCQICGKEANLERTYFKYDIKCDCHEPNHFELSVHCKDCVPVIPMSTFYKKDGKKFVPVGIKPINIRGKYREHAGSNEIKENYG